jgi:hypothetical protein
MLHFPPAPDTDQKFQYAFMEPGQFQYFWFLSSWMKFALSVE